MTMQTSPIPTNAGNEPGFGQECDFNAIESQGFYAFKDGKNFAQVPAVAVQEGHSPLVTISGSNARVVRLSTNPYLPISKARQLASQADIDPQW